MSFRTSTFLRQLCFGTVVVLFALYWHYQVTSRVSISAVFSFAAIVTAAFFWGSACLNLARLQLEGPELLPLQFLCGNFVLGTSLFVASLLSPLGIVANLCILVGLGACASFFTRHAAIESSITVNDWVPILCLGISGAAATLWSSDALNMTASYEGSVVFTLWFDSFFHSLQISELAHSHGYWTMSDVRMAGAKPHLYHYASYAVPAALSMTTGTGAYELFAGFLIPFGILLTGLAAFSLAAYLWGAWAGIAATVAIMLLPDAYQQGFGNRYLSYNFHQQVGPASFYGVAYLAVAWTFVFDACRMPRVSTVFAGWVVALLSVLHKAQLFVANAFLILFYPFVFSRKGKWSIRFGVAGLLAAVFVMTVWFSQQVPGVPTLRLDGSGADHYLSSLRENFEAGPSKAFFTAPFWEQSFPWRARPLYLAFLLVVCTFGAWAVALVLMAVLNWRTMPRFLLAFPFVVMANYLVMACGLALDRNGTGTADELLNRPLVWAYFVVVTWTAGSAYHYVFGRNSPRNQLTRATLTASVLIAFGFPLLFGKNLQTFPLWPGYGSFREHSSVSRCFVEAAHYIRSNSQAHEIIQDAGGDPKAVLTALAERREFAVRFLAETRAPAGLKERLMQVESFNRMTQAQDIKQFAEKTGISWYVVQASTPIAWPAYVQEHVAFSCDDVRVFRFQTPAS